MASRKDAVRLSRKQALDTTLRMIAAARIFLKDVNIAATTALQAIDPLGREKGLSYGANIIMPLITPGSVRKEYMLYDGKPCMDEGRSDCKGCLEQRIGSLGRKIGYNQWGDSPHSAGRHAHAC
jgi:biotin synthase